MANQIDNENKAAPRVLLTGATGLVGGELVKRLDRPIVTSRNREKALSRFGDQVSEVIQWDALTGPIQIPEDLQIDSVVNLMGEPIGEGRWNDAKKKRIRDSRVLGTRNLIEGLKQSGSFPRSFVSASAIGVYPNGGDETLDESSQAGNDFLANLVQEWEQEAESAKQFGAQVTIVRTGLVLGRDGGILKKMLPIFRWGLGGKLASGTQWMSWIHLEDLVRMLESAAKKELSQTDVVILNGTAPHPVRNLEFTKTLGRLLKRPTLFPVPRFALKLALGEFAQYTVASQRVLPNKAIELGFQFQFDKLDSALSDLLEDSPK